MRADADSDFPVKPFEKIQQFVGGEAAKMAVHQSKVAAPRECRGQEEYLAAIFSLVVRQ